MYIETGIVWLGYGGNIHSNQRQRISQQNNRRTAHDPRSPAMARSTVIDLTTREASKYSMMSK